MRGREIQTGVQDTSGPSSITQVASGDGHSVAASSDGVVWTWGTNANGRLGDGTTRNRLTPIAISDPGYAWRVGTPSFSANGGPYYTVPTVAVTVATVGAQIY